MNSNNTALLDESISALLDCKEALIQLATTCCMPERGPNMDKLNSSLDELISTTNTITVDVLNAQKCITAIGPIGSQVGFLYTTCCTATREPLYQRIFTNLMQVHSNSWAVLGHSH